MYHAYGLLTAGTDLTLPEVATRLQVKFPAAEVRCDGGAVHLTGGDWHFQIFCKDDVAAEHADLAEKLGSVEDNAEVAACNRRVEVWSDTSDPFLEHLADFQSIVEVLQSFRGVIAIDPTEPAYL
jgi:hypothetical protein